MLQHASGSEPGSICHIPSRAFTTLNIPWLPHSRAKKRKTAASLIAPLRAYGAKPSSICNIMCRAFTTLGILWLQRWCLCASWILGERNKGFRTKKTPGKKAKPIGFSSHLSGQPPRCRRHHRATASNSENSGRLWGRCRRSTLVHLSQWSFRVQKHWFVRWWLLSACVMEIVEADQRVLVAETTEAVLRRRQHLCFSRAQQVRVQLLHGWRRPDLLLIPSIIHRRSHRQLCWLRGIWWHGCRDAVLSGEYLVIPNLFKLNAVANLGYWMLV
jgi:hypothetical protein